MSEFVRVRTESGYEASVSRAYAEARGAEVLDSPATNSRGLPLPASRKNGRRALPRTTAKKAAAAKAAAAKKAASSPATVSNPVDVVDMPEEATQ